MDNIKREAIDGYTRAVAEVLLEAKKASGMSFTALADETGLGRATVERVLNGKRNITLNYLRLLCDVMNVDLVEVIEEADATLSSLPVPADLSKLIQSRSTHSTLRAVAQADDGLPDAQDGDDFPDTDEPA